MQYAFTQNYVLMALIKHEGYSQQHMGEYIYIYIYIAMIEEENKSGKRHNYKHVHFKSMVVAL